MRILTCVELVTQICPPIADVNRNH